MKGNKGEWSEPYALLKIISDKKLFLGDTDFQKVKGKTYEIVQIIRNDGPRIIRFILKGNRVEIRNKDRKIKTLPVSEFTKEAGKCYITIMSNLSGKGSFSIDSTKSFLNQLCITKLKQKSEKKDDITVQIIDPKTFISPSLGFSIKSQMGSPSTLLNASKATNFTYLLAGNILTDTKIEKVNSERLFSQKSKLLEEYGARLEFESVDNEVFKTNLQTIDFYLDKMISEILLTFYFGRQSNDNTMKSYVDMLTKKNPLGYNLELNPQMYEFMIKRFLADYSLGMRAAQVWKRDYEATGGYLVVRKDGEIVTYHFYFLKSFEDYLFFNTKLDTPDPQRHNFGKIYSESGRKKMKLNLQIRFTK